MSNSLELLTDYAKHERDDITVRAHDNNWGNTDAVLTVFNWDTRKLLAYGTASECAFHLGLTDV